VTVASSKLCHQKNDDETQLNVLMQQRRNEAKKERAKGQKELGIVENVNRSTRYLNFHVLPNEYL
jgi:hypothetical protein